MSSPLILAAALAFFPNAPQAGNAELAARERAAEEDIASVIRYAALSLPPCEAHRRLAETIGKYAPPASCPRALAVFRKMEEMEEAYARSCENYRELVDSTLARQEVCSEEAMNEAWAGYKKGEDKIKLETEAAGQLLNATDLNKKEWAEILEGKGRGEFARRECAWAVRLAPEAHAKHARWLRLFQSIGAYPALDVCAEEDAAGDYRAFLRGGENEIERRFKDSR